MIFKPRSKPAPATATRKLGEITESLDIPPPPLGGTRKQAMHRLQIGLAGLGAIILMVVLAGVVMDRANRSEELSVPAAAATVAAPELPPEQTDPLVNAGVVPDLPADAISDEEMNAPILPERGVQAAQQRGTAAPARPPARPPARQ